MYIPSWSVFRTRHRARYVSLTDQSVIEDGELPSRYTRPFTFTSVVRGFLAAMAPDPPKEFDKDLSDDGVYVEHATLSDSSSGTSATFNYSGLDPSRFYKPIDTYEGLHRWDPHFEWTAKEEKQVVRRV